MPQRYADRPFVITGGSSGLGLAIARAFWSHGARVCLIARDETRMQRVLSDWSQPDGRVFGYVADVTSPEQVATTFSRIRDEHGPLLGLVNAVGRSHRATIQKTTSADLQALWEVNVLSVVHCVQAALDDLVAQRGYLVNIGSLASKVISPYLGAYPSTKFALAAYTHQLRVELEVQGVRVLLVCPGPLLRDDAGHRYDHLTGELPPEAARPGGGANLRLIDPAWLAERIVRACDAGEAELVVPGKVKWLAAIAQLRPRWADALIRRSRSG